MTLIGMPYVGGWHAMWRTLLQFNPTPADALAPTPAPTPAAAPAPNAVANPKEPQRASEVNVVNHSDFTHAQQKDAAASELLSKNQLWDQVQNTFIIGPNLFWIALPHFEGELRIGLGHIVLPNLDESIERNNNVALTVHWFARSSYRGPKSTTSSSFYFGQQPNIKQSVANDINRKVVRDVSGCKFGDLLPIKVTLTPNSAKVANTKPRPEKRCVAAMLAYCKEYTSKHVGDTDNAWWREPPADAAFTPTASGELSDESSPNDVASEEEEVEAAGPSIQAATVPTGTAQHSTRVASRKRACR